MHRFYLPPKKITEGDFSLCEREGHHAANVLRVRAGERVAVLDGEGTEYMCDVASVEKNDVRLTMRQQNKAAPLPYRITLLQAMTKGKSMDFIIQKATELCVHRIVPLAAGRSVVQVENVESRLEKWNSISIDSIKQCGSPWLPVIEKPVAPRDFLARNERFDLPMAASLQSHTQHPREYVDGFLSDHGQLPKTLAVWVGPEGDFTPAEINDILTAGVHPITLGQVILRSETAAIYTVSALNYELQSPRS
ncbi:MAG: RsmE family RNA methyltransferase [Verrucomicrobiota bacterium]|jgi:16S rRNA (uracil1498-N3)-methyltransferase|nr:RsmE family RNA methyltransferase [Verrucomicrobiota bacterium]MEE2813889.1 RsmE family RNA methyltransferase [Verrucomicrobiota bacterium]